MVHRPNTLVRLLESFIGENPICTGYQHQYSRDS
nr:MAG TPA: hypothetical protein [Caudoviricetes sp.]DAQ23727.1 MAG TPA: hypothetical protein [Caudoviricetes sp.]DAS34816.1 MAG TPA: hypothetical protein [Caudoviricetes sp.]DAT03214.1 MAG TPA: hypothetical protein [Caudoviricetes sp.]